MQAASPAVQSVLCNVGQPSGMQTRHEHKALLPWEAGHCWSACANLCGVPDLGQLLTEAGMSLNLL